MLAEIRHLLPAWNALHSATNTSSIRAKARYPRTVTALEARLDEVVGNERHPAISRVNIVGDLIADYKVRRDSLPA